MAQTAIETRKMEWENEITNQVANMVAILLQNHIPSCNIDAYPSLLKDEFGNGYGGGICLQMKDNYRNAFAQIKLYPTFERFEINCDNEFDFESMSILTNELNNAKSSGALDAAITVVRELYEFDEFKQ